MRRLLPPLLIVITLTAVLAVPGPLFAVKSWITTDQNGADEGAAPAPAALAAIPLPDGQVPRFGALPRTQTPRIEPNVTDTASTLDRAVNKRAVLDYLKLKLDKKQVAFLNQHKFLLVPKSATRFKGQVQFAGYAALPWDEMLGMFDEIAGNPTPCERLPENTRLVTPAIVLHAFHKYLENTLEELEKTSLRHDLLHFTREMRQRAIEAKNKATGPLAGRLQLVAAQFTVPLILLENSVASYPRHPEGAAQAAEENDHADTAATAKKLFADSCRRDFDAPTAQRIERELDLIYAAEKLEISPLFGQYSGDSPRPADYTQYTPRSHYTKSSNLRAYFRCMMYFGRNTWLFETTDGVRDALLITWLMANRDGNGQPLVNTFRRIMSVTGFFAGPADDIGYPVWRDFVTSVAGRAMLAPTAAVDDKFIESITARLGELAPPRILSDAFIDDAVPGMTKADMLAKTKGFRVFGQRFTFDAFTLGRLTAGQEKTEFTLPSTPTALFVAAALGSRTARDLSEQFYHTVVSQNPDDQKKFHDLLLRAEATISRIKDDEWFVSVAGAWLKTLGTLTRTFGKGYPQYMQSPLYPLQQIQELLGSYAELKHDTLLYAKQNYAEFGGGDDEKRIPPVPRGFVEPNLAFWYQLQRLVAYFHSGLQQFPEMASELEEYGTINRFKNDIDFLTSLAEKELAGTMLSEDEHEKLRVMQLSYMAKPYGDVVFHRDEDFRSGLVADIHTDIAKAQVLYQATAEPYVILALIGNEKQTRLAIGITYNHYEFTEPLARRLDDAAWQKRVYGQPPELPAKPDYYKALINEQ